MFVPLQRSIEAMKLADSHCWVATSQRGFVGERLGRGAGASTEFLDHRPYVLGDELRRVDWRAFARTDQLLIRRYREEVRPQLELLLDNSASMGCDAEKRESALGLAQLIARSAQAAGIGVRCRALNQGLIPDELLFSGELEFDQPVNLAQVLRETFPRIRLGAEVVVISDFLAAMDPSAITNLVAARAQGMSFLQILGDSDLRPEQGGLVELVDSETGLRHSIDLSSSVIERYQQRLNRLQEEWSNALLMVGGVWSVFDSQESIHRHATQLVELGRLRPQ